MDSEPVYLDFFRAFFPRNGRPVNKELLLRTVGSSNRETWRLLSDVGKFL